MSSKNKTISQRIRREAGKALDKLGIGDKLRQAYVEGNLLGERTKFLLHGRPEPSTAIILAGSGRSGTTWLTDVLCAMPGIQQIFEPLIPLWNSDVRQITSWDKSDPYYRAIYLKPNESYYLWQDLWERILTGKFRNYWTDYERTSWFPNRFLIKEIRANMMLGYLYKEFQPKIIYIMRHPCAVISSRLRVHWHADVNDVLLQRTLVEDYLLPYEDDIRKERDLVGAHAVWWAVENHVALDQLKNIPHYVVYYEDLVANSEEIIIELISWLGYSKIPDAVNLQLRRPSRMSGKHLASHDPKSHLAFWQKNLPSSQQQRVLYWAQCLGLKMYNEDPFPQR